MAAPKKFNEFVKYGYGSQSPSYSEFLPPRYLKENFMDQPINKIVEQSLLNVVVKLCSPIKLVTSMDLWSKIRSRIGFVDDHAKNNYKR